MPPAAGKSASAKGKDASPKRRKSKSPKTKRQQPGWARSSAEPKASKAAAVELEDTSAASSPSKTVAGPGPTALHTMAMYANDATAVVDLMKGEREHRRGRLRSLRRSPTLPPQSNVRHHLSAHPRRTKPLTTSFVTADDLDLEVDAVDYEGCTALTYAAKCGHHHFVRGLCEQGASVDVHPDGPGGLTPLAECCFYMNVYLNSPERHPAIEMIASEQDEGEYFGSLPPPDYVETVRHLLDAGADPNFKAVLSELNEEPLSPLDLLFFEEATAATSKVATACAKLLVDGGADVLLRDETNQLMPHEKASAMGFKAAAALLRAQVMDTLTPRGVGYNTAGATRAGGAGGGSGFSTLCDPMQEQERLREAMQRVAIDADDTEVATINDAKQQEALEVS